ncbi:sigma-54-dependent Fis family transcriptional regulator [Candidatus Sumerlaeota bacterium]|nr:sigma-54-dependent Fis family transcriptional regulator [Candidatus Sumerlaeota bacterium]
MSTRQRILVVDDERDVITGFRRVFEKDDVLIDAAHSGTEAIAAIKAHRPDLVMMDLRMPGLDGLQTLRKMQQLDARLLIILMTAYSTSANVIEAMKHGAYDYLVKPFSVEKLREVVKEALRVSSDRASTVSVFPAIDAAGQADSIVGRSEAMQRVYKMIGQVASSNAPVLVTGESGTGKELIARAIFSHGDRASMPFIAVNCAAIPDALLESELFGHERGAFTSAAARRTGKFEQATGGTLFLDEIGDMSPATQAKVLRVLQSGEFERIGGSETLHVDVRVITATNRPLERMIEQGLFRADLYYRLNVVRVEMPSLRERRDDIPLLIEFFMHRLNRDRRGREVHVSAAALEKLVQHEWPGNVRELENTLRNAVLVAKSGTILPADLRLKGEPSDFVPRITTTPPPSSDRMLTLESETRTLDDPRFRDIEGQVAPLFDQLVSARARGNRFSTFDVMERALIVHALNRTGGNQLRAANILGITRSTLRKRIARYKLDAGRRSDRSGDK